MNIYENEPNEHQELDSDENTYTQIFQIYDQEKSGSIKTDQFILLTQNLIKDNGLDENQIVIKFFSYYHGI